MNKFVALFEDFDENDKTLSEDNKFAKATVLYVKEDDTNYECKDCIFFKEGKCALYGQDVEIEPYGSCNMWVKMDKTVNVTIPWIASLTKEQTGYAENEQGFSCKRCEYFTFDGGCLKVQKDSEGDTSGLIDPNACCSKWDGDAVRSSMEDTEVIDYIEENPNKSPEKSS